LPHVYDTDIAVRILGEDGSEEIVKINQEFEHKGKRVTYNLNKGKYDVSVSTGPSFESKRQEAVQAMLDLTKALPQTMSVASDLMVRNMDWPGAQEIADRLKKTLPPGMADDNEKKNPVPPEVQAQMQQMSMMVEQLTGKLNEAQDKLDKDLVKIESQERIALQEQQVKLQIELAKIDQRDALAMFQAEIAQIENRLNILNQQVPIPTEQNGGGIDQPQPQSNMPTGGLPPGEPTGGFSPGPQEMSNVY
jgi:hypothetical protein